jgi:hypothetical protein
MEKLIEKLQKKHSELLIEYQKIPASEKALLELSRSRMKDILEFIDDLNILFPASDGKTKEEILNIIEELRENITIIEQDFGSTDSDVLGMVQDCLSDSFELIESLKQAYRQQPEGVDLKLIIEELESMSNRYEVIEGAYVIPKNTLDLYIEKLENCL